MGETFPASQYSHTQVTHREGELMRWKRAGRVSGVLSWSLAACVHRRRARCPSQAWDCGGSTRPVGCKSGKAASLTRGAAQLEQWVVEATRAEVPLMPLSRQGPYPRGQICGFTRPAPPRVFLLTPHYLSVIKAHSDSTLDCQKCPESSLCSCFVHSGMVVSVL